MVAVLISVISIYLIPLGLLLIVFSVILRFRLRVYFTQKFFEETKQIIEDLEDLDKLKIKAISSIQAATFTNRIISQKLLLIISEEEENDLERPSLRLDTLDSRRPMLSEQDEAINDIKAVEELHCSIRSKKDDIDDNNYKFQTGTTIDKMQSTKLGTQIRKRKAIDEINSITAFDSKNKDEIKDPKIIKAVNQMETSVVIKNIKNKPWTKPPDKSNVLKMAKKGQENKSHKKAKNNPSSSSSDISDEEDGQFFDIKIQNAVDGSPFGKLNSSFLLQKQLLALKTLESVRNKNNLDSNLSPISKEDKLGGLKTRKDLNKIRLNNPINSKNKDNSPNIQVSDVKKTETISTCNKESMVNRLTALESRKYMKTSDKKKDTEKQGGQRLNQSGTLSGNQEPSLVKKQTSTRENISNANKNTLSRLLNHSIKQKSKEDE